MKALQYKRQERNGEIKIYIGVYANDKYNSIHPAEKQGSDLYICRGLFHNNAFDIQEIEVDLLDMANGRSYEG